MRSQRLSLVTCGLLLAAPVPVAAAEWPTYGASSARLFFNADETLFATDGLARLGTKWTFPTGAIVTASPTIATVDVPDEGEIALVFVQSWDGNLYALRFTDGSELWRFATEPQPGAPYPDTGSVDVTEVGGSKRVFFGAGETMYSLDAATGSEIWRFEAGTGCEVPPGLCGFASERNETETSPIVAEGKVFFGMDVNDRETGKGGFYAVDVDDGRMLWFFDLESGSTCVPLVGDEIRKFDGYHTEEDLDLPVGFLATRPGCDFDRTPTGCGNVWSSPAYDPVRQLLYVASSNCDTDNDPGTSKPPPPMPPYDEALFALDIDGVPAWRWRPREVDNFDLAFGAVPQLFTIDFGGDNREVVGIGNKDGTYYVLDRDGVNEVSTVAWDDVDPSTLPYWTRNLVEGGPFGGIIGTPSVDVASRRVFIGTAAGDNVVHPQQPTVHALDLDSGDVVWQNTAEAPSDATFAPTTGVPGIVIVGSVLEGTVRFYDATSGLRVADREVGFAVASGASVADGTLVVGAGIGERSANSNEPSDITSRLPSDVTALCILGAEGCPIRLVGDKLSFKDPEATKRKLSVRSTNGEVLFTPVPAGSDDPTLGGATLTLTNPDTAETQSIALPPANWKGLGSPAGSKGYQYSDRELDDGPCKSVLLKPGRLLKASCGGAGIAFTLDETSQGSLAVSLTSGAAATWDYCVRFGGTIKKDEPGLFRAAAAAAPSSCE